VLRPDLMCQSHEYGAAAEGAQILLRPHHPLAGGQFECAVKATSCQIGTISLRHEDWPLDEEHGSEQ
jgi:hypothetical protein